MEKAEHPPAAPSLGVTVEILVVQAARMAVPVEIPVVQAVQAAELAAVPPQIRARNSNFFGFLAVITIPSLHTT
jgi:hypothetical protein